MGPIFHEKIRNHGSDFQNFPANPRNFEKVARNGYLFLGKILKHGYSLLEKLPLNMGMGPELPTAHPQTIQIWDPPPGTMYVSLFFKVLSTAKSCNTQTQVVRHSGGGVCNTQSQEVRNSWQAEGFVVSTQEVMNSWYFQSENKISSFMSSWLGSRNCTSLFKKYTC